LRVRNLGFACRNLYYYIFDFFITDQNRYLRVIASELSDIRSEQRDLRRIIAKKQSGSAKQNSEGNRHPQSFRDTSAFR
jgi:hypothetical protein